MNKRKEGIFFIKIINKGGGKEYTYKKEKKKDHIHK